MFIKKNIKKIIPSVVLEKFAEYKRQRYYANKYKTEEFNNPGDYYSLNAFDYYKCIFVHIPKAAGISVSKSLFGNFAGGHKTYIDYQKIYSQKTLNKYYTFTFVRNPYTRLFSAYSFLKAGGINEYDQEFNEKTLKTFETFETFVLEYLSEKTIYYYTHFVPQYFYLINNKNEIAIDFIGRFENIEEDFKIVTKKLNKKIELPHFNKTNKDIISLKDEVKEKIFQLYQKDFELLNYSK